MSATTSFCHVGMVGDTLSEIAKEHAGSVGAYM
jgi:hypothetical protein